MKERIKLVRLHPSIDLSQDAFGKRLGITAAGVSRIESGTRNPSEQIILAICRTFNVREEWLRTGEGEMFAAQETLALDDPTLDDLDRAILQSYIKMPPARRAFFKKWVKEMIAVFSQTDAQKEKAAPEISEAEYEKAQAIVDAYRAQKNEYVKKGWPTSTPEEDEAG